MKPATAFFRSCGLTVLLAGAVNSYAGVYVKNPDDPRYFAEETKCKQEVVDAETLYVNDKLRCKDDHGCLTKAFSTFQTALHKVDIHRNNNNGTHQKAIIDFQRASESKLRVTGTTPKDKAENLRHFSAETTFKKEVVDADTQYENDEVLCFRTDVPDAAGRPDAYGGNAPPGCWAKANSKWADALLQIQIHRNTEDGTHRKNEIAIARSDRE